jgi:hypothetical protein
VELQFVNFLYSCIRNTQLTFTFLKTQQDVQNVMSAAVAAKRLRQRIPTPEEIMAAKSAAGHGRRGRPPKKVKSCPPMDTGKLHSQKKPSTPTNQAQVFETYY